MEVSKRLASLIGDRPIAIYDHATSAGKIAGRLDLVERAAETPRRDAECLCNRAWWVPGVAPQDANAGPAHASDVTSPSTASGALCSQARAGQEIAQIEDDFLIRKPISEEAFRCGSSEP
jgi:hypothetical protein